MFPIPENDSGVFHDSNHVEFAIRTNKWTMALGQGV